MTFRSSSTPFYCSRHFTLSSAKGIAASQHTPLSGPQGPWPRLVSFRALSQENTKPQNTPVHKPRHKPSGYALVNLSITLKPLGPAVVQTQTHKPTSWTRSQSQTALQPDAHQNKNTDVVYSSLVSPLESLSTQLRTKHSPRHE